MTLICLSCDAGYQFCSAFSTIGRAGVLSKKTALSSRYTWSSWSFIPNSYTRNESLRIIWPKQIHPSTFRVYWSPHYCCGCGEQNRDQSIHLVVYRVIFLKFRSTLDWCLVYQVHMGRMCAWYNIPFYNSDRTDFGIVGQRHWWLSWWSCMRFFAQFSWPSAHGRLCVFGMVQSLIEINWST